MSKRLPIPTILPRKTPPLTVKTFMDSLKKEVETVEKEKVKEKEVETKEKVAESVDDDGNAAEALKMKSQKKATVVCVKVGSIRPRFQDLRQWMADPNNVYIARKGVVLLDNPTTGKKARFPPSDSKFANPYTVKDYGLEKCIELYRTHLKKQIADGTITKDDLEALKGKNLGCWCKPGPCHGDVLLEFI